MKDPRLSIDFTAVLPFEARIDAALALVDAHACDGGELPFTILVAVPDRKTWEWYYSTR